MTISSLPRTGVRPVTAASGLPGPTPSRRRSASESRAPGDALALAPGLCLVERDDGAVQIGVDPVHRILVRRPPPATVDLLRLIDRAVPRSIAVRRIAVRLGLPVTTWNGLLDELVDGGFLIDPAVVADATAPPGRVRTRSGPAGGTAPATAPSGALSDAVVVVIGTGRVASSLASLLAAAGAGHVFLDPDRAIRPGDAAPAGLAAQLAADTAAVIDLPDGRLRPEARRYRTDRRLPGPHDRAALAATLRRARPEVEVHRPAGYVRPGLVVVATDAPPDPVVTRRLVTERQPHLAVHAGLRRGVVGPLVLPGRSSCLLCHDLFRRDRDSGWPRVRLALQNDGTTPPVVLATSVAAVAAEQALQFLTGGPRPAAVDGTLELTTGEWAVRRRSWRPHPACSCHFDAAALRPPAGQEQ